VSDDVAPPPPGAREDAWLDTTVQVAVALGGGFLVFVIYVVVQVVLFAKWPSHVKLGLLVSQVLGLLLPALGALALARRAGFVPATGPRRRVRPGPALGLAVWTSANALLGMLLVGSALALAVPDALRKLQDFMSQQYAPLLRYDSASDVIGLILVATIVPAICEETVFRGFVQRVLRGRLGERWSIGLTAAMFAAVHVEPLGFLARLVLGIGLGIAFERTGSLRLSMVMHASHNLMALLIEPWDEDPVIPGRLEASLVLLGVLAALPVTLTLWRRALRALPHRDPLPAA
jgi:membrane protease YdiL (CAAX protease family)